MSIASKVRAEWKKVGDWLLHGCWHVLDIYHQLKPCRFSFIIAVLGGLVFLWADQGTEVLRALAERHSTMNEQLTAATGATRLMAFAVGMLAWCLASWYTARVLLYFDFPGAQKGYLEQTGGWLAFHGWLARNVPRILGAAPMWIVGVSLLLARKTYQYGPPKFLRFLGLVSIASGFALWAIFYFRRWFLSSRLSPAFAAEDKSVAFFSTYQKFSSLSETKQSQWVLTIAGLLSILLLVLFTVNPVHFAGDLGTGAVLAFAAASWIFWGSALVYIAGQYRIPLLTLIVIWVALCSLGNDNHDIRTVSRGEGHSRLKVEQALRAWHDHIRADPKYATRSKHPLFIVTAEGGGIRAAYWTAAVLGSIQDAEPGFADHVFAISSVSGGSVGAAVFDALIADGSAQGHFAKQSEEMLGQDFLSPAIAAMLYPDFAQRFLPWPCTFLDRGHWMEESWERAWRDTTSKNKHANNYFADPFSSLWKHEKYVPALFLNATAVENGNRVIASNMLIETGAESEEQFLGAEDLDEKIKPAPDVPLSTAAHLSARFTYVSPAARFHSDGTHAVDGGYFENSGATTALDILRQINTVINADPEFADVTPRIIMISNSPIGVAFGNRDTKDLAKGTDKTIEREASHHKPGSFLEDGLAPVYALLNTRDARGVYAQRAIGHAQETFYRERKVALDPHKQVYFFSLAQTTVPLPLGWMLSNRAAEAIQLELYDSKSAPSGPPVPILDEFGNSVTSNKVVRDAIVSAVRGEAD